MPWYLPLFPSYKPILNNVWLGKMVGLVVVIKWYNSYVNCFFSGVRHVASHWSYLHFMFSGFLFFIACFFCFFFNLNPKEEVQKYINLELSNIFPNQHFYNKPFCSFLGCSFFSFWFIFFKFFVIFFISLFLETKQGNMFTTDYLIQVWWKFISQVSKRISINLAIKVVNKNFTSVWEEEE